MLKLSLVVGQLSCAAAWWGSESRVNELTEELLSLKTEMKEMQADMKAQLKTHGRKLHGNACEDSPMWYKKGEPSKDCAWVAGYPESRCDIKGYDETEEFTVAASDACLYSCYRETAECACYDSTTWYKTGEPAKSCDWVAQNVESRCTTKGFDGTMASTSCPSVCAEGCMEGYLPGKRKTAADFAGTWWIVPGVMPFGSDTFPAGYPPDDTVPAYMLADSDGNTTLGEPFLVHDQTVWWFEGEELGYIFGYVWAVLVLEIGDLFVPVTASYPNKIMCSVGERYTGNFAGWTTNEGSVTFQFYQPAAVTTQDIGLGAFDYVNDWFVMQISSASVVAHWSYMVEETDMSAPLPGPGEWTINDLMEFAPPYQYGYASPVTVNKTMIEGYVPFQKADNDNAAAQAFASYYQLGNGLTVNNGQAGL